MSAAVLKYRVTGKQNMGVRPGSEGVTVDVRVWPVAWGGGTSPPMTGVVQKNNLISGVTMAR